MDEKKNKKPSTARILLAMVASIAYGAALSRIFSKKKVKKVEKKDH